MLNKIKLITPQENTVTTNILSEKELISNMPTPVTDVYRRKIADFLFTKLTDSSNQTRQYPKYICQLLKDLGTCFTGYKYYDATQNKIMQGNEFIYNKVNMFTDAANPECIPECIKDPLFIQSFKAFKDKLETSIPLQHKKQEFCHAFQKLAYTQEVLIIIFNSLCNRSTASLCHPNITTIHPFNNPTTQVDKKRPHQSTIQNTQIKPKVSSTTKTPKHTPQPEKKCKFSGTKQKKNQYQINSTNATLTTTPSPDSIPEKNLSISSPSDTTSKTIRPIIPSYDPNHPSYFWFNHKNEDQNQVVLPNCSSTELFKLIPGLKFNFT